MSKNMEVVRNQIRESSARSGNTTEYAAAERHGNLFKMKVRRVNHPTSISECTDLQAEAGFTEDSRAQDDAFQSFELMQIMQSSSKGEEFQKDDIDPRTLRFADKELENEYRIYATRNYIKTAIYIFTCLLLYCSLQILNRSGKSFGTIFPYIILCILNIPLLACAFYIKRHIKLPEMQLFCSRLYYATHAAGYFLFILLFCIVTYYLPEQILTQIEVVILAVNIVVSGDYVLQNHINFLSNVLVFSFVYTATNGDSKVVLRSIIPLCLTTIASGSILRLVELRRKSSFYSIKKLRWIKQIIERNKKKTKFLLSNLYPTPLLNSVSDNREEIIFHQERDVSVMCLLIYLTEKGSTSRNFAQNEIDMLYRCGVQKANSSGLCITFVTGLFGESRINLIDAGYRVLHQCSQTGLKYTKVSIGIGSGVVCGGVIKHSKSNFDVIGEGVDRGMNCSSFAKEWQVVVDEQSKEMWAESLFNESNLSFFEEYRVKHGGETSTKWVFRRGQENNENRTLVESEENSRISKNTVKKENLDDAGLEMDINTEDENESNTDPFLLAKRARGWKVYFGDLRFADSDKEEEYQRSLRTKENKQITMIQMTSLYFSLILFGYVDYSILSQVCPKFDLQTSLILFVRYFVAVPILGFILAAFGFSKQNNIIMNNGVICPWDLPFLVGSIFGMFNLIRLPCVYFQIGLRCSMNSIQSLFLYSPIYEAGFFFSSLAVIRARMIYMQLSIWFIFSVSIILFFQQEMGITEGTVYFSIAIRFVVPFGLFSFFTFSRESTSRKEYLDKKKFGEVIEQLYRENQYNETALLSCLGDQIFNDLKGNKSKDKVRVMDSLCVIMTEIKYHQKNQPNDHLVPLFGQISNIIRYIEETGKVFGMELVKATSTRLIFIPIQIQQQNQAIIESKSRCIERSAHFCFKIQSTLPSLGRVNGLEDLEIKICIDSGNINYGIIGKEYFMYDCYGESVTRLRDTLRLTRFGDVVITDRLFDSFKDNPVIEMVEYNSVECNDSAPLRIYRIQEKLDILGMFCSNVEWLDNPKVGSPHHENSEAGPHSLVRPPPVGANGHSDIREIDIDVEIIQRE